MLRDLRGGAIHEVYKITLSTRNTGRGEGGGEFCIILLMPAAEKLKISRTASVKDLRAAARRMAASDPWLKLGLDARRCFKSLAAPYRETYSASSGGVHAGHVTINMNGLLRGYIQVLFVAEGRRGRGVGEGLMRFAEKKIFRDSPNVFLCVSSFNKGAIRFYRGLGYRKAGLLENFLAKGHDEILMRKTRGPLLSYKTGKK